MKTMAEQVRGLREVTPPAKCACATNCDGSVTMLLCPIHAEDDPCITKARVTGRRRHGSIQGGCCSRCGWMVPA